MIRLPIKKLRPGMITSQSIYNARGASYLTKGIALNQQYISRLGKIGIPQVNVTALSPNLKLMPPEDIVQEKTRIIAVHRIFNAFQDVSENSTINLDSLKDIAETILFDLIARRQNLVQLTDIRLNDSYTFTHSVNVAILATMLGLLCRYSKGNLMDLALGGFLHDIGKTTIPPEILAKTSRLSQNEYDIIRMHPEAGRQKLHNLNLPISALVSTIAAQHHEHIDGSGYPNHLSGNHVHRFARIVAIADVYDALTSDRPYKKAYSPFVAYKLMTMCSAGQFDEELLRLFFDNVAIYPVGTILRTKMGYAIVRQVTFGRTRTPIICLFTDRNTHVLPKPLFIDLAQCPPDTIEQVLDDNELYRLIQEIKIDPAAFIGPQSQSSSKR